MRERGELVSDPRQRVDALISRALDAAATEEEARSCAMIAVRLIAQHRMLNGSVFQRNVEDMFRNYGPPAASKPQHVGGFGCSCTTCQIRRYEEAGRKSAQATRNYERSERAKATRASSKPERRVITAKYATTCPCGVRCPAGTRIALPVDSGGKSICMKCHARESEK